MVANDFAKSETETFGLVKATIKYGEISEAKEFDSKMEPAIVKAVDWILYNLYGNPYINTKIDISEQVADALVQKLFSTMSNIPDYNIPDSEKDIHITHEESGIVYNLNIAMPVDMIYLSPYIKRRILEDIKAISYQRVVTITTKGNEENIIPIYTGRFCLQAVNTLLTKQEQFSGVHASRVFAQELFYSIKKLYLRKGNVASTDFSVRIREKKYAYSLFLNFSDYHSYDNNKLIHVSIAFVIAHDLFTETGLYYELEDFVSMQYDRKRAVDVVVSISPFIKDDVAYDAIAFDTIRTPDQLDMVTSMLDSWLYNNQDSSLEFSYFAGVMYSSMTMLYATYIDGRDLHSCLSIGDTVKICFNNNSSNTLEPQATLETEQDLGDWDMIVPRQVRAANGACTEPWSDALPKLSPDTSLVKTVTPQQVATYAVKISFEYFKKELGSSLEFYEKMHAYLSDLEHFANNKK